MKNLSDLVKAAQEMQARMTEAQSKIEALEAEGQSGAGAVKIAMNGKGKIVRVRIDPAAVDPADMGMIEDLIIAAAADAKSKIDARVEGEMKGVTGGLGLPLPPGFKLPF